MARGSMGRRIVDFLTPEIATITLTSPAEGDTILTSAFTVTWDLTGVQARYRVDIYSDATGTATAYSSGFVNSSTRSHDVPAASITSGRTYWIRVFAWLNDGSPLESEIVSFDTAFPTSVNVTGVTLAAIGAACVNEGDRLPGIRVTWAQITPGAGETFLTYEIRRRIAGETAYTTIATISTVSTLTYDDYNVSAAVSYQYAVVWTASHSTGTLTSVVQSPPKTLRIDFDFVFVHDVRSPSIFARFDSWELTVEPVLDIQFEATWGRQAPTAFVGESFAHRISIRGLPQMRTRRDLWATLVSIMERQSTAASVLCVRLGRDGEIYFANLARMPKDAGQKQWTGTLELQEVHYDEVLAVA